MSDKDRRESWIMSQQKAPETRASNAKTCSREKHGCAFLSVERNTRKTSFFGSRKRNHCWVTPGDFTCSASSRSVIFHEGEEVRSESEEECVRRREWMRAEIRCTSKTVFFLSLASWHVYGEASRMWGPAQHIHQTQRETERVERGRRRAKRIKFPQFHGTSPFFFALSLSLALYFSVMTGRYRVRMKENGE